MTDQANNKNSWQHLLDNSFDEPSDRSRSLIESNKAEKDRDGVDMWI
jgi:hypothetical protein